MDNFSGKPKALIRNVVSQSLINKLIAKVFIDHPGYTGSVIKRESQNREEIKK